MKLLNLRMDERRSFEPWRSNSPPGKILVIRFHAVGDVAVTLPSCAPGAGKAVTTPLKPNAWVRVSSDGSVTIVLDRSEMGQGVFTSLPTLVAEELDVPWEIGRAHV